jgi:hypothetical protein
VRLSKKIINEVEMLRDCAPQIDLGKPEMLVKNLVWLYQVIVASENLMKVAYDEGNSQLRQYLGSHMHEERDHAKWLADDLSVWGIDAEAVPLERSAVELAGLQYYLIYHKNPNAILGYMAVLEGFPFPLDVLELLENIHGSDVLRCLRYHAENDIEHRKELFRVIDQINDPVIFENAIRTQYLMNEVFRAHH